MTHRAKTVTSFDYESVTSPFRSFPSDRNDRDEGRSLVPPTSSCSTPTPDPFPFLVLSSPDLLGRPPRNLEPSVTPGTTRVPGT